MKFYIWRFVRYLYGGRLELYASEHAPQRRRALLDHSYILIDWIEDANVEMLSTTFSKPHTDAQTENLYRGISEIMLSLARRPQSRIGSWTICNNGQISLTNRPMFCHLHMLENWSIPTGIPRSTTYTSADSFYLDLITGHDNRLLIQRNISYNKLDAQTLVRVWLKCLITLPRSIWIYRMMNALSSVLSLASGICRECRVCHWC